MRHRKNSTTLGKNSSHRKAMLRNLAKSFILHEKLTTTVEKAKELRKVVEPLITLAKEDTVQSRRRAVQLLAVRFNTLTSKEARAVKAGDKSPLNDDRKIVKKLFEEIGPKFKQRPGGYTRIVRLKSRVGDGATVCVIESVE